MTNFVDSEYMEKLVNIIKGTDISFSIVHNIFNDGSQKLMFYYSLDKFETYMKEVYFLPSCDIDTPTFLHQCFVYIQNIINVLKE